MLLPIYVFTLGFDIYNVVKYLIGQGRWRNWLLTIFYVLSNLVLISRILEYCVLLKFYSIMEDVVSIDYLTDPVPNEKLIEALNYSHWVGYLYVSADYIKYALGYFQLASMAELAIAIHNSIANLKKVTHDSLTIHAETNESGRSNMTVVNNWPKVKIWTTYIVCSIFALTCLGCGAY